jgi:lipoprotein-anchoring transpeptidase ErfK/SrfK
MLLRRCAAAVQSLNWRRGAVRCHGWPHAARGGALGKKKGIDGMIMQARRGLAARAMAAAALCASLAAPASAQLLWDWGGGETVDGSGREVVRFNPQYGKGQIIVSFTDRRLYFITEPGQAISYPIAVPREQSRWQGVLTVTQKRENPAWTPTPTMLAENPKLPRWVPGGHPMNPLGVRGLYLGASMYRIHGTDAPWTIGTAVSKGCIRLYNQDVLDLYPRVNVGARVTVTYDTFATGSAVASKVPVPSKGLSANDGGTLFNLFGEPDDDPPPPKAKPRATKSKASPRAATTEKSAAFGAPPRD